MSKTPHTRRMRRARGSTNRHRRLVTYVLAIFGNGETAPCAFGCGVRLTRDTVTLDRYPVPGRLGGPYAEGNVRPACKTCNDADGKLHANVEISLSERLHVLQMRFPRT